MIIRGRKRYHFELELDSTNRNDLARELVAVLNHAAFAGNCPYLFQLLSVVETVEHGATGVVGSDAQPSEEVGQW